MQDVKEYDGLIVVTPADFDRLSTMHDRMAEYLPVRRLYFIGSDEVGKKLELEIQNGVISADNADRVGFINENSIIPFETVRAVISDMLKDIPGGNPAPRGLTGWYYQQFLKLSYADTCSDEYYLVWDGDTVPCRSFSMFSDKGQPYFDYKQEYHEEYFKTISKLLPGMRKVIKQSFISEHMLYRTENVKQLIEQIERNESIPGSVYWEKVIRCLDPDLLQSNSFSEFETYGTYMALTDPSVYRLREWHSFRTIGLFLNMTDLKERDFEWFGRDFFALSFEKGHKPAEDNISLFNNPEYQAKLSARQMVEVVQGAFYSGSYKEVWESGKDDPSKYPIFIAAADEEIDKEHSLARELLDRGENVITYHEKYGEFESFEKLLTQPLKGAVDLGAGIALDKRFEAVGVRVLSDKTDPDEVIRIFSQKGVN